MSAGASGELERLRTAIAQDPAARALLDVGRRPRRASSRRCARSTARRARRRRRTSTSSATGCSTASTSPAATRSSCPTRCCARSASPSTARGPRPPTSRARIADVRAKVPERAPGRSSTSCSSEARLTYRLRDERGVFSDIWASGIMRRAALAGGRRLAGQGPDPRRRALRRRRLRRDVRAARPARTGRRPTSWRERSRAPHVADRQGRPAVPRRPAAPAAGPVRAAARRSARVMRAMGIAIGEMFGSSEEEHEEHLCAGWRRARASTRARRAASPGRPSSTGSCRATCSSPSRRPRRSTSCCRCSAAIVTDSGGLLSHAAIVAREYGIPGVVGTREATELDPRRRARARRRRRRRGGGARVSEVVPLEEAHDDSLFGSKAVGLGEAARAGLPLPPGVALSGAIVEAVAARRRARRSRRSARLVRPLRRAARRALVGGRRGRRGRELRRPAPDAAQRAVGRRGRRGAAGGLVVGELRLGDHLPPARRPLHAPERRRRRPGAARSRVRRRDVHPEPDQRRRRADDRGELGARRGGRRGPRDPRQLPHRPLRRRCSSARRGSRRSRSGRCPDGGTVEEEVAARARRAAVPRRRPARGAAPPGRPLRGGLRPGRDIEWAFAGGQLYLLQCRAITRAGRPAPASRPRRPTSLRRARGSSATWTARERREDRARCSRSVASPRARP